MRNSDNSGLRRIGSQGAVYAGAILLVALVVGGGGSPAPMSELVVQVFAACAAMAWLFMAEDRRPVARRIWVLVLIVLALPLLQLVPLPPSVWQELPGRELAMANLAQAGAGESWQPLSLMPHQTLASALAIVPALLLMVIAASVPVERRGGILAVIVAVGVASLLIGVGQLKGGSGLLRFYDYTHERWIIGFQANRNATADIFLIAVLALGALWPGNAFTRKLPIWAFALAILALSLGAVFTGSRAGIALLVIAVPVSVLASRVALGLKVRRPWVVPLGLFGALALGALAVTRIPAVMAVADRFDANTDFRAELWQDGLTAMETYWPVGGGVGAFRALFLPFERLEVVDATMPNRAHNDYLELLIEGGIFGAIALAACGLIVASLLVTAWRRGGEARNQWLFSIGAIGIIAAHSLVDYPLRSMSLACLLALAVGFLSVPKVAVKA